jgi:hypothetical protein
MSADFSKICRIGTVNIGRATPANLFVNIKFSAGKLSITGVEGPLRNGDALGSCGQIDMHPWDVQTYAAGWDADKVARLRAAWSQWHLNDMTAGSPAQEEYLRANPVRYAYPQSHYDAALAALSAAGLQPDASHMRDGKAYSYGSAWLRREVPADVIEFLRSLPDTDITPAWV